MKIRTLADVKRCMKNKCLFYVVDHWKKECIGQVRIPNIVQTNGVYTQVYGNLQSKESLANNGRGTWFDYRKAKDWEIDSLTGHCEVYTSEERTRENCIMEIVFLDEICAEEYKEKVRRNVL